MCGRYTLSAPGEVVAAVFELVQAPELKPRYNVAPTQEAPVVRAREGERRLHELRWGLVPLWAESPKLGSRAINARAESLATRPAFRESFARRRCLVVADGFYEWRRVAGKRSRPFHIRRPDRRPFALAGLWARWRERPGGEALDTFTIVTTAASPALAELHDRMPVLLPESAWEVWLDREVADVARLAPLLRPFAGELEAIPVTPRVNKVENDDPSLIEPFSR